MRLYWVRAHMIFLRTSARKLTAQGYDRISRAWDRSFVPATIQAREHMLRLARLKPGERVLDIGTGTGASAISAARKVGKKGLVLGIDLSRRMLAEAKNNATRFPSSNVKFRLMDSTAVKLPEGSFDVIISSFGTPEGPYGGPSLLRSWLRILTPGGRMCICEGSDREDVSETVERILANHKVAKPTADLAEARRLRADISKENKRCQMIFFSDPRKVIYELRHAGFVDVKTQQIRMATLFPNARAFLNLLVTSDLHHEYKAMPAETRLQFKRDLARALGRFETPRGFLWSNRVVFSQARKGCG